MPPPERPRLLCAFPLAQSPCYSGLHIYMILATLLHANPSLFTVQMPDTKPGRSSSKPASSQAQANLRNALATYPKPGPGSEMS